MEPPRFACPTRLCVHRCRTRRALLTPRTSGRAKATRRAPKATSGGRSRTSQTRLRLRLVAADRLREREPIADDLADARQIVAVGPVSLGKKRDLLRDRVRLHAGNPGNLERIPQLFQGERLLFGHDPIE